MWTIHSACNNDCKLACNAGQEDICFCGDVISVFASSNEYIDSKVIDGSFYNGSDFIKLNPFLGISLNE